VTQGSELVRELELSAVVGIPEEIVVVKEHMSGVPVLRLRINLHRRATAGVVSVQTEVAHIHRHRVLLSLHHLPPMAGDRHRQTLVRVEEIAGN
jgi:hypothetical protein